MADSIRLDAEFEEPQYSDVCLTCARFHLAQVKEPTCDAFPGGIPRAIWRGDNLHLRPYDGDNGLTYIPRPGVE